MYRLPQNIVRIIANLKARAPDLKLKNFITLTLRPQCAKMHPLDLKAKVLSNRTKVIRKILDLGANFVFIAKETDKKGRLHYHIVSDAGIPTVHILRNLWQLGYVKLEVIRHHLAAIYYLYKGMGCASNNHRLYLKREWGTGPESDLSGSDDTYNS